MNDRIRELAEQAMWSKTDYSQENELYSFSRDELEKFTELIVQECADIATNRYQRLMDGGKAIKEHFGVKL
jgi:hypothetical protein